MSKSQMLRALRKMKIADAVDVSYCRVRRSYKVKVYLGDRCITGEVATREAVVARAEEWYCNLVSASY